MATAYWVRLAGLLPLSEIAAHSAPTWETLADGGIGEVSFELALSPKVQHHFLRTNVKVEVMLGATPVATAMMTEPDRTTWAIKAQGYSAQAQRVFACDMDGNVTRDLGVAIATAQSVGWWTVTNPFGVGGVATGDSTGPQTIAALADEVAAQQGKRWGVDARGQVFMRSDPTASTCVITPEAAAFGVTDEGRATMLIARYQTGTGTYATRIYPGGPVPVPTIQETVDLTDRGALTGDQVDAILAGHMARGKNQIRWTNGVTLDREEITRRGVPATLATVTAGVDMARATGMSATFTTSAPWLDVVIGKTRYTAGERSIYLEPMNTAPRNAVDVWAA